MTTSIPKLTIVLGQRASWPDMLSRAIETEALGFDGLYLVDHFFGRADVEEPTHEAWTMLGALAPFTQRLRLGVMVSGNTYRNPVFLLKQAVTVDHISAGRVDFGVGAGWHQREHEAYDFPLPPPKERVDRFIEAIEIWNALQANERTTYEGQHYQLLDAPFQPKPVQSPRLPLLIGSSGPRMMRMVARHADIWNMIGTPEEAAAANQRMDEICRAEGRDPATLERSVSPAINLLLSTEAFANGVQAYVEAGFQHVCLPWPRVEAEVPVLREVGRTIIPQLRGTAAPTGQAASPSTPREVTMADRDQIRAILAVFGDAPAARFIGFLAAHPEVRYTGAALQEHLGWKTHAEVTIAAAKAAEALAATGLPRLWHEAQDGYLMSRPIAAIVLGRD